MSDSSLISMKKVEIIMSGEDLHLVEELLVKARVSGFTIVPEERVAPILAGLGTLFERHPGVVFVSDVWVTRKHYFEKYARHAG